MTERLHFHFSLLCIGGGNGNPLQCSCLENPRDGEAWWAAIFGVAQSRARLSDFTFTFHFHALEEDMATHSSVIAWRTPGTAGPGGLPSTAAMWLCSRGVAPSASDCAVRAAWTATGTRDCLNASMAK